MKLEHRQMAEQSIAKSFKGILRIAHIMELLPDDVEDIMLKSPYYRNYEAPQSLINVSGSDLGDGSAYGYQTARQAFDGGVRRYSFPEDDFKNNKVPVTDSLGNYIAMNVGTDGITFGFDESNDSVAYGQFYVESGTKSAMIPLNFSALAAKHITLGLSSKVKEINEKTITGTGAVHIEDGQDPARLVIQNAKHNTMSLAEDVDGGVILPEAGGSPHKTIFDITNGNPRLYDVMMHRQEYVDWDSYNDSHGYNYDSYVRSENLVDYVQKFIDLYTKNNIIEVPTGQIIWQYIDLNKWYATTDNGETAEDGIAGNRPAIPHLNTDGVFEKDSAYEFDLSLYQGATKDTVSLLKNNSSITNASTEMIPLYKRDYVLADGGTFKIVPLQSSVPDPNLTSFERFGKLWLTLGYDYTDETKIKKRFLNKLVNGVYEYTNKAHPVLTNAQIDKNILFTIDFCTVVAFYMLYNELNNPNSAVKDSLGKYSRPKALAWLKSAKLPTKYILPTYFKNKAGVSFNYTEKRLGKTITFDIGQEVNSFTSEVQYYSINGAVSYPVVQLWQTAEIQAMLDLFENISPRLRQETLNNYYTYFFQVPNMNFIKEGKYKMGGFIGSGAYFYCNEENSYGFSSKQVESSCTFSMSMIPHRHYIFKGAIDSQFADKDWKPINQSSAFIGNNPLAMATADNCVNYSLAENNFYNNNSYIIGEINADDGLEFKTNVLGGIATKEFQLNFGADAATADVNGKIITGKFQKKDTYAGTTIALTLENDPRFKNAEPNRGYTSIPLSAKQGTNEKATLSSASMGGQGVTEYFMPESVNMLPLIHL